MDREGSLWILDIYVGPQSSYSYATSDRAGLPVTGQFADKQTRGQSSRGLDNSRTSQLADSEFLKIMKLLYFTCILNLTLTVTVTLSNIGSV